MDLPPLVEAEWAPEFFVDGYDNCCCDPNGIVKICFYSTVLDKDYKTERRVVCRMAMGFNTFQQVWHAMGESLHNLEVQIKTMEEHPIVDPPNAERPH